MTDLFTPLVDDPAYRKIANLIEQRIVARSLRTGDALPSETDLARAITTGSPDAERVADCRRQR